MRSYLKSKKWYPQCFATLVIAIVLSACQKDEVELKDPYAGGKASLGIEFISKTPAPAIASPGEVVELKVKGLKKYEGKFKFYVNELEAQIVELTDAMISFRVPNDASTGGLWVTLNDASIGIDNQTFFGPGLQIAGKLGVDKTFAVINGANSTVYIPLRLPSGNFVFGGAFDDYETTKVANLGLGGIVQVSALGAVDKSLKFGLGANGPITSMTRITSGSQTGKIMVGGVFSSFNSRRSSRQNINFLTRLNVDGSLDTAFVDIVNITPNDPTKNKDTVPSFNGGVGFGSNFTPGVLVRRVFSLGDKVYVVGNFGRYLKAFYERSTFDTKVYDATTIRQIVKMSADGSMDSTYRFDVASKTSPASGNGAVNDAIQLADGSLILVGNFTSFDGATKNRIVKLKPDGTVDQTFATGTGANNQIYSIGYNATTNKIVVAGEFTTFNGQPLTGVALLNVDGSLSTGFTFPSVSGGTPTFARQMNSGKIIVAGTFNRYSGVLRQGFMVLNANGTLANGYNNTGVFVGEILDMIEVTSSDGHPAAILTGNILRFNNSAAHNVIKIELQN